MSSELATLILDGLNINDGVKYLANGDTDWSEAELAVDVQSFMQTHGGVVVEGTDLYKLAQHKFRVRVLGTDGNDLRANISALQRKVMARNVILEFRYPGVDVSSFADVLYTTSYNLFGGLLAIQNRADIEITCFCKPFWYGEEVSVPATVYSQSPLVLDVGDVQGDVPAPCFLAIKAIDAGEFGDNLYIGSRKKNVPQDDFNPIKSFGGTVDATAYSGEKKVTEITTSYTPISGTANNLRGCYFFSSSVGWVCGDDGYISFTDDSGQTFTDQDSTVEVQLNDIKFVDADDGVAVGNGGVILLTTDGGDTWVEQTSGTLEDLVACSMVSSSVIYAVGSAGSIVKTTDGGANWSLQTIAGTAWVDISMYDATNGYIVGGLNIYKTTNGTDWTDISISGNVSDVYYAVHALSATDVWISGGNLYAYGKGIMIHSTDGGANGNWTSWTKPIDYLTKTVQPLIGLHMLNDNSGWAISTGRIYFTSDGWGNVITVQANLMSPGKAISIVDSTHGFVVGLGFCFASTSNGAAWTQPISAWSFFSPEFYEGTFRLLAHVKTYDSNPDGVTMKAQYGWAGGTMITLDEVALADSGDWQWVDLGEICFPISDISPYIDGVPAIFVQAKGSETDNLDLDVAVILPVDGPVTLIEDAATTSLVMTTDSSLPDGAVNKGTYLVDWLGTPIVLMPGEYNNIVIMETGGIRGCEVAVRYNPRFLSPIVSS